MAEARGPSGHRADRPFELVVASAPFEAAGRRIADFVGCLSRASHARHEPPRAGPDRLESNASPGVLPRAAESEIRLAIPGGSALAAVIHAAALLGPLWQRIALTWVDERCVPIDDPDSNRGAARSAGLLGRRDDAQSERGAAKSFPGPARIVPLFEDGESPDAAVARAALRLSAELGDRLDVAVLGMGADGHVASLFPDREAPRAGCVAFVPDAPKPPPRRITLTRAALATARHTLLVAVGEEKRAALDRLCAGDPRLPATGLPGLVVVTDLDLAAPETNR